MKPAKNDYIVGLYKNTRRLKFVVCFVNDVVCCDVLLGMCK